MLLTCVHSTQYDPIMKHEAPESVGRVRGLLFWGAQACRTRDVVQGASIRTSTSHVERQNLTMRMQMRRFTRLTNGFSKKADNPKAAVSLHFGWYNFVRAHRTTRVTPAMAAGVENRPWEIVDLMELAS